MGPRQAVFFVNGENSNTYYDASSASVLAAAKGFPTILVKQGSVPANTLSTVTYVGANEKYIVGGLPSVTEAVRVSLGVTAGNRWYGTDRYSTATAVANNAAAKGWLSKSVIGIAQSVPDAIAGGAATGAKGGVLLLTAQTYLPTQTGGGHEHGLRAGTPNLPYIVGLAEALKLTVQQREFHNAFFTRLRDRVIAGVLAAIPDSALTGHPTQRLPNHASFVLRGLDGNELLMHLDLAGIAVSSGSACKTGDPEPSEVLLALGLTREWALGSLRVTLGRSTTDAHVDRLLEVLLGIVDKLRLADRVAA
jgi:hypothetical protein